MIQKSIDKNEYLFWNTELNNGKGGLTSLGIYTFIIFSITIFKTAIEVMKKCIKKNN